MDNNLSKIALGFTDFVVEIKQKIRTSQYEALKAVNKELISLYWDIGRSIVLKQEAFGWGKSVVQNLSDELQKEFVGIKGFSVQNLWNMRLFYLEYRDSTKLQPMVREIGWVKNVIIFQKSKDDLEREYYIRMTKKFGWTKNILINQMNFDIAKLKLLGIIRRVGSARGGHWEVLKK